MTKRDTSIAAYREIKAKGLLSKARFEVYSTLYKVGPCTAGELFQKMNWPIKGSVCARLDELRKMGCVEDRGVRVCDFSGLHATLWDVNSSIPQKFKPKRLVKRSELVKLLIASFDELRWCHDSLFKQMVKGKQLTPSGMTWMAKLRDLMIDIEAKVNIKEEREA
jgi:hypothetical protein